MRNISSIFLRRFTTICDAGPSSSIEKKILPTLSFCEYIKVKYPEKLVKLDRQVDELNEQRIEIKKNTGFRHFFKDLNNRVLKNSMAELICVGSMVTKFVNKQSDFDFVFFPKNDEQRRKFLRDFHQNPSFKQNFMNVFAKLLERESRKLGEPVEKIVELPRLRVPLLIIQFESGLSMDIQFPEENYHAIRNTQLIRCYKQCDERFTLLFLWLRTICDRLEIRNSKYGLLSSYHLLLLVVHFLQSEQALSPWPVLPVLSKNHQNLVSADLSISQVADFIKQDPPIIDFQSHNKMTISELIIRFVDYYSHFNPSKEAIYIEKGLALKRKQTFGDVKLQIIDPYSPTSVCRSSHAATAFFQAINFIRSKFKQGEMIASLPTLPESQQFLRETHFCSWRLQMNDKTIL
ncbi:unnamed protein product [Caenorhabditis angaria]|uniref:Poly(A) RNA polymerase mitochondrial-like central palm domain-containing protein n=1 Tax=Caenorhabditis angaria TaxID=860376 RepID=A0A9P1IX67_9PELO|nr:unnamed protein product [Caenorhabditis angaria]